MPASEHRPNEELARYMESKWSNRFSVFCNSLRQYPLPITSGAAATVLHGSSPDALQAVSAYCCTRQLRHEQEQESFEWNESELDLFSRPNALKPTDSRMMGMMMMMMGCSPFRYFKTRRFEEASEDLSVLPYEARKVLTSAETFANSNNENDILFSLLDASSQLHESGHVKSNSSLLTPRSSIKDQEPSAEAKLGVRELQAMCVSRGLLTRGTKKELIARLHQHNALQHSGSLAEERRTVEKQHPREEHNIPMANRKVGITSPKRVGLRNEEMLEYSQCLRTPFRSSSTSQRSPDSTAEPAPKPHRLLATPQEYVAALIKQKRSCGTSSSNTGGTNQAGVASPTTMETNRWPWRILVDNRERIRGAHECVLKAFEAASVSTVSCTLPCGDFMIGIDIPAEYSERGDYLRTTAGNDSSFRLHPTDSVGVMAPAQSLFSVVLERKTTKDLCASIAGSRYYDQRRLLSASPFQSVVWVVEGCVESLRPDEQRRVLSACASLATVPNFRVVRTRHLAETVLWLRHLGMAHISALAKATQTTTGRRITGEEDQNGPSPPLLADCAACMEHTEKLRRAIRARTTFPRVLMCLRGCSTALATQLASKYGSLLQLWRRLRDYGREACDADEDIRRLSSTQKDVYVRLTEFLLAEEYC